MTISSTSRSAGPFVGSGAIIAAPFTFKVFAATDVKVTRTVDGVDTVLVSGADYTVALNADQDSTPGGTVTTTAAVAVGASIAIDSEIPETQSVVLTSGGPYLPKVIEAALDRVTALIQQLSNKVRRTLRVPDPAGIDELPGAAARANKVLSFDTLGRPVAQVLLDDALQAALTAAAAQVGINAQRKAVIGTGDATADTAALREAIRTAAANTRIEIFGRVHVTGTVVVKPLITIANGSSGVIYHETPDVNLFEGKDDFYVGAGLGSIQPAGTVWTGAVPLDPATNRTINGFPGWFRVEGLTLDAAYSTQWHLLANAPEELGTFTKELNEAAYVWLNWNGQHDGMDLCRTSNKLIGFYGNNAGWCEVTRTRMFNHFIGVSLNGSSHQSKVDLWTDYCFIGLATNYGTYLTGEGDSRGFPGQQFLHCLDLGNSVFQRGFVGCWLEGLWESTGGCLYFELNAFRDIQFGVGTNRQSASLRIQSILTSSPVNGQPDSIVSGYNDASIAYTIPTNANLPAPHNKGLSIDMWSASGLVVEAGIMSQVFSGATKKLIQADASSDRYLFQFDRITCDNPYDFEAQERGGVAQGGKPRFGINSRSGFYSWDITWDDLNAKHPTHNDGSQPSGRVPLAYMGYVDFLTALQRPSLWVGTKAGATSAEGSGLFLSGHQVGIGSTVGDETFFLVKAGPEFGVQQGWCEFLPGASVRYSCNQFSDGLVFEGQGDIVPTVASAGTMNLAALGARPTSFVSGTAAIEFIEPGTGIFPPNGARLTFIPTAAWTTVVTGNIARAITAVVNQPVDFIYNAATGTWYPK